MAKFISFTLIALFSLIQTAFSQQQLDSVRLNIAVLDKAKAEKTSIVVEIKNLSFETKKLLKQGRIDYVNGKIKPIGNYIVELEKLENEKYIPFPPTADIDPVIQQSDYYAIKPNSFFIETINLSGKRWSSNGFPKGQYRIRIAFNWNEWSSSLKNISKWITFTITE